MAEAIVRKPKVFIVGISGFLGYNLALRLRKDFLVSGAYFRHHLNIPGAQTFPVDPKKMDILDPIMRVQSPDIVINALGLTDKKAVETLPKLADTLNILMAVSTSVLANKLHARMIQLSCASIYDGADGNYAEDDLDFSLHDEIAKQKLAAESYIRAQTMESTILRVGRVLGLGHPFHHSEFDRLRIALDGKKALHASQKQVHSYISTASLFGAVEAVLTGKFPGKHRIFNVGGPALTEFDLYQGWAKLVAGGGSQVKPAEDDRKRDHSVQTKNFVAAYPGWKPETKEELYLNLLGELSPGTGTKKWQKTLQIP